MQYNGVEGPVSSRREQNTTLTIEQKLKVIQQAKTMTLKEVGIWAQKEFSLPAPLSESTISSMRSREAQLSRYSESRNANPSKKRIPRPMKGPSNSSDGILVKHGGNSNANEMQMTISNDLSKVTRERGTNKIDGKGASEIVAENERLTEKHEKFKVGL
jgi:hypothetical protein